MIMKKIVHSLFYNLFVNVVGVLAILGLPFGVIEGMWAEPSLREFARSFDGSRSMWISLFVYYGVVIVIFFLKFQHNREPRK